MQGLYAPLVNYNTEFPQLETPHKTHSLPAMYLQSSQFACPGPAMSYIHLHEQFQQSLARPYLQQQPDSSFGKV